MATSIFTSGEILEITDVLASRDRRVLIQRQILHTYPEAVLLDVKLNITGPIKNNIFLHQLFKTGEQRLISRLPSSTRVIQEDNLPSGNEAFLICNQLVRQLKKSAVAFEENDALGRLFDIDVLTLNQQRAYSRQDLNLPPRKCFVCARPAKECARSRRHDLPELQRVISQIYQNEFAGLEVKNHE
ncbi:citrate lyase holo-[acyl-carrier protein] synthase [Lactobacillus sp. XV13L]|nr:citrate lyase holo-[acyl-carrier protein] synthase [Lactobacillus sp. XV13L]